MDVLEWLRSGKYLPAPLRDFHAQKEVFKTIWLHVERSKAADPNIALHLGDMTWVSAHIFVIDRFLHFMAAHGWTLQRSRKPYEFDNLDETLKERRDLATAAWRKMMDERAAGRGDDEG